VKPLALKQSAPTVVRHNAWAEMEDGSFRCGNVVIRCDERIPYGGYAFQRWHIYRVGRGGKLTRVWAKSRPWGYGCSGSAKIGAGRISEPQEGEGGTD